MTEPREKAREKEKTDQSGQVLPMGRNEPMEIEYQQGWKGEK